MYKIIEKNPALKPYEGDIELRMSNYKRVRASLLKDSKTLVDFANAHHFFGIHLEEQGWVYREWAPAADAVYLEGDFNNWDQTANPLKLVDKYNGVWEIQLPKETLHHGSQVKTVVKNGGRLTEHLPLYARHVVQNHTNWMWTCQVFEGGEPFAWTDQDFKLDEAPYIYEAHVGMCLEEGVTHTYTEFADQVLPRIKKAGYNTIQLMAIMEHPYYGSFGYQVSNFYAACSRYGEPEGLKYLVNKAHGMGIRVLLDVVHSHAVKNVNEGINLFDGTAYQFFHDGPKGEHPAWGTKCFNYGKPQVIHFLLSNLKFWMEEYHFDGFRFDGVTSMLYLNHGLGENFDMSKYFSMNTDTEAITYLQLATELIHTINPDAVTIAEDMSGMTGMCQPIEDGGIGFDYRLGMGLPDMWIKLVKEKTDETWNLQEMWNSMCLRDDKTIAYVESHDQALVGDQTMIFRLAGAAMYTDMDKSTRNPVIDRAIALHKLIRLLTISAAGDGYLNFMGNEFGHPEWIDFPREGNGWNYQYCRRQWSLLDNGFLKYEWLNDFDREMIALTKAHHIFDEKFGTLKLIHVDDHILAFERGGLLFVFNFHPAKSFEGYRIPVSNSADAEYEVALCSDDTEFGGDNRVSHMNYPSHQGVLQLYLPSRTAIVLQTIPAAEKKVEDLKPEPVKAEVK